MTGCQVTLSPNEVSVREELPESFDLWFYSCSLDSFDSSCKLGANKTKAFSVLVSLWSTGGNSRKCCTDVSLIIPVKMSTHLLIVDTQNNFFVFVSF